MLLYKNLSIYYTWKNIQTSYKNNKFKMSAPTRNEEFELPDGSFSVSDSQEYFLNISKFLNIFKNNIKELLIILQ